MARRVAERPAAIEATLRRGLDFVYLSGAIGGALCLVAIILFVLLQVAARWVLIPIPGLTEAAGYAMAGAFLLPLGYAFKCDTHIRVTFVLDRLPARSRWIAELACLVVGFGLATLLAWYSLRLVWTSYLINDVSQGADATPLWIPQSMMALGTILLALALLDRFVGHVSSRQVTVRPVPSEALLNG